ncbi:MAG: tetratricopeptide repeat protein, partial [Candidatus Heimdallarchaeota archaeon]|nr:tetratricopeptide repeat protein [Candidatus Heimdallarchaeota archaeon]
RKEIAEILAFIGAANGYKGNTDEALKVFKKSYKICEELDLKAYKALILLCYGAVCFFSGEFERSKDFLNKSLMISEELDYKLLIAMALKNLGSLYDLMGDFDGAMKTWEGSLKIAEDMGYTCNKVSVLDSIIQILIKEDDLELAEKNLRILKEICEQAKIEKYDRIYRLNKALIMKTSLRARNRADAEEILKNLVNDTFYTIETKITALLNLCDLLVRELQITGDMEILDEIQQYIEQLLEISEKTHYYFFMAELYLLQARLSLLTLNLK